MDNWTRKKKNTVPICKLRYFSPQPESMPFDLNHGYPHKYLPMGSNVKDGVDHVLRWMLKEKYTLDQGDASTVFLTSRGRLTKIFTSPYQMRGEGWKMAVTLYRKTFYIDEVRDSEDSNSWMVYWGYKFEQYVCADQPNGKPNIEGHINTSEAFYTVVESNINSFKLLFSGEVDCMEECPKYPTAPGYYVEMKTSLKPNGEDFFYRHKMLKWWAQSFLVGLSRIFAGYRNTSGIVHKTEMFEVQSIPELCQKNIQNSWEPQVCMNFLCEFLSFVQKVVTQDNPSVVYLFTFDPSQRTISVSIQEDAEHSIIPSWYIEANQTETVSV
ncbi:decapping and exoribonuclease protein isoform X2 [Amia ocellicauda]|uniref:decapping and exoribonuclease protein isoform X2 n=1 Tax=Amia ocellicauda TaxID=2972642 RepID=UPI003464CD7F